MIGQLKTLHRVKSLKEEQALRALQAKRRQVEDGRAALARAEAAEAESRRTLGSREDAIYAAVLGRVVDRDALDDTRAAVVSLERDHARLTDGVERAAHVLARLDGELTASATAHRTSVRARDKYAMLLDDAGAAVRSAAEAAEESEIEDLFAVPRGRPA